MCPAEVPPYYRAGTGNNHSTRQSVVDVGLKKTPVVTEMAAYQKRQVLYSATQPLDGSASLNATSYSTQEGSRGLVPYVSLLP